MLQDLVELSDRSRAAAASTNGLTRLYDTGLKS